MCRSSRGHKRQAEARKTCRAVHCKVSLGFQPEVEVLSTSLHLGKNFLLKHEFYSQILRTLNFIVCALKIKTPTLRVKL